MILAAVREMRFDRPADLRWLPEPVLERHRVIGR
jgi:hypothetical protein